VQRQSSVEVRTEPKRRSPEEFQFVKHRVEAGVTRMTLNRPEHNLLNVQMLRELADGIACVAEREDVKLIVLDLTWGNIRRSACFRWWTRSTPCSWEYWRVRSR
jgi:1,4-dihydroxy-2-naphthoyl-CoA synthase